MWTDPGWFYQLEIHIHFDSYPWLHDLQLSCSWANTIIFSELNKPPVSIKTPGGLIEDLRYKK